MSRPASPLRLVLFGLLCLGLPLAGCQTKSSSPSSSSADTSGLSEGERSVLLPGLDTGFKEMLQSDVPFVRTPTGVVDTMLSVANVTADDVVYDLGSGDGRIPIRAARTYGARAVGIEIKSDLVDAARVNAREAGVSDLVTFRQGDLFEADISEATVVTLYLVPSVNLRLRPKLFRELEPGTRVVSHDFDMDEWVPDTTIQSGDDVVYRWTIPETPPSFVQAAE
jgi:SAM-dependent methyltransferase